MGSEMCIRDRVNTAKLLDGGARTLGIDLLFGKVGLSPTAPERSQRIGSISLNCLPSATESLSKKSNLKYSKFAAKPSFIGLRTSSNSVKSPMASRTSDFICEKDFVVGVTIKIVESGQFELRQISNRPPRCHQKVWSHPFFLK